MKKVIELKDLCCRKCAERAEKKLLLLDNVRAAKAKFEHNLVFVETALDDGVLRDCLTAAGFEVIGIRERRGIFG